MHMLTSYLLMFRAYLLTWTTFVTRTKTRVLRAGQDSLPKVELENFGKGDRDVPCVGSVASFPRAMLQWGLACRMMLTTVKPACNNGERTGNNCSFQLAQHNSNGIPPSFVGYFVHSTLFSSLESHALEAFSEGAPWASWTPSGITI